MPKNHCHVNTKKATVKTKHVFPFRKKSIHISISKNLFISNTFHYIYLSTSDKNNRGKTCLHLRVYTLKKKSGDPRTVLPPLTELVLVTQIDPLEDVSLRSSSIFIHATTPRQAIVHHMSSSFHKKKATTSRKPSEAMITSRVPDGL